MTKIRLLTNGGYDWCTPAKGRVVEATITLGCADIPGTELQALGCIGEDFTYYRQTWHFWSNEFEVVLDTKPQSFGQCCGTTCDAKANQQYVTLLEEQILGLEERIRGLTKGDTTGAT